MKAHSEQNTRICSYGLWINNECNLLHIIIYMKTSVSYNDGPENTFIHMVLWSRDTYISRYSGCNSRFQYGFLFCLITKIWSCVWFEIVFLDHFLNKLLKQWMAYNRMWGVNSIVRTCYSKQCIETHSTGKIDILDSLQLFLAKMIILKICYIEDLFFISRKFKRVHLLKVWGH